MSAEKLHAVTAMLDAWETARVCLWHKLNARLAEKGTRARLRDGSGTRARLPNPPAATTLASAISAFRVAARSFGLHILVTNQTRWLYVGNCPMTEDGLLSDPDRLEHYLHEIFDGYAADDPDADFWRREIVEPTMKHADDMRAALKSELENASADPPVGESGRSVRRGSRKKARLKEDVIRMQEAIKKYGALKPRALIVKARIEIGPGYRALRKLEAAGTYHRFERKKRTTYRT